MPFASKMCSEHTASPVCTCLHNLFHPRKPHGCLLRRHCLSAVQLMERVKLGGLLESYLHDRSRFSRMLSTFPLYVVMNEGLGLLGTREYAIRLLNDPEGRKTKAPADKK